MSRRIHTIGGAAGGGGGPTVVVPDASGFGDAIAFRHELPDGAAFGDAPAFTLGPTEAFGVADALASVTANPVLPDAFGGADAGLFQLVESAQPRTGTPDSDSWGDAWVNRAVGQTGVNHGNEATMSVAAVLATSQQDGYLKINFNRFVSLAAQILAASTLSFTAVWPTVALNPSATLQVDFQVSAGSPFTESTITAANRARFTTSAPFTRRTFAFPQDGATRTHTVTFTQAETDAILAGRWLLVQFTVPDLTAGTFAIRARENASASHSYDFRATR